MTESGTLQLWVQKSDCKQVSVGKCFTLEDEAIGTVPICLTQGSSKTHPEAVSELKFMIQSDFYLSFLSKFLFQ